ncbi:related to SWD2 - subunit of the COMPASS complex [Melanopsichium pennsylvanicum]|uniref:Related to SWD2 - subunit of the COMPASS complex n=2 Tax=Melanopsichium pennsylvanicum TaxID=63383 RepID=A0AAJ4XL91_9BASI|nr:wd40 repeat-like protein [Melanopsichium pennsylvanicum 4]SNX84367.1 related to SWD2 - subunit of the COMPASS complex [Melanopsichium pennsylvanicum]
MAAVASGSSSRVGALSNTSAAAAPSSTTSTDAKKLAITTNLISSFKPAKVFTQYVSKGTCITSTSFDDEGSLCVTSAEDDYVHIYDVRTGTHKSRSASQKYGVHLARFTHDKNNIIHASTKENNAIRYMNLKTKSFIRYFDGHENKVVSLQMSPQNDTFLSASVDEAVRLWDLRAPKSMAHMHIKGHPVAAYDPTGKVFAVAINERSAVLLYDIRKFDQMPFLVVYLDDSAALSKVSMPPRVPIITSLTFTNDSQYLLLGTSGDVHYVIDTFSERGQVVARLIGHEGLEKAAGKSIGMVAEAGISGQEVCWTPNGKWVLSGSADGSVVFWYMDVEEAKKNEFKNLRPRFKHTAHDGASRVLAFNPRYAQLMSGGAEVAFWLPDLPEQV